MVQLFFLVLLFMKIAIHIFLIYMLALSLVPCGDGGGGVLEIAYQIFEVECPQDSGQDQHSNGCEDEPCSPFCICSCCLSALETSVDQSFQVNSPLSTPDWTPLFNSEFVTSPFYASIWQPPKLS